MTGRSGRNLGESVWFESLCLVSQVCVAVGAVILISGLSVLLVGYATPPRLEAFGQDELLFVDGRAMRFNRALDACKLGGAVLFCVGGAGMAAGLLLLAACGQGGAKDELHLQRRFKERLAEIQASVPNPGDAKVPVTLSKVQNVQPGTEPWPPQQYTFFNTFDNSRKHQYV